MVGEGGSPPFREADRPSVNGIIERNQRTVKIITERGRITPLEAIFGTMSPKVVKE